MLPKQFKHYEYGKHWAILPVDLYGSSKSSTVPENGRAADSAGIDVVSRTDLKP